MVSVFAYVMDAERAVPLTLGYVVTVVGPFSGWGDVQVKMGGGGGGTKGGMEEEGEAGKERERDGLADMYREGEVDTERAHQIDIYSNYGLIDR